MFVLLSVIIGNHSNHLLRQGTRASGCRDMCVKWVSTRGRSKVRMPKAQCGDCVHHGVVHRTVRRTGLRHPLP